MPEQQNQGKRVGRAAKVIGRNLTCLRKLRGLSQKDVADILQTSFQQVQKYEKGVNRIPAERLFRLKTSLNVPYECFFIGLDEFDPFGFEQ